MLYLYIHVCINSCMCVCIYVCMQTNYKKNKWYILWYTHTHTCTYTYQRFLKDKPLVFLPCKVNSETWEGCHSHLRHKESQFWQPETNFTSYLLSAILICILSLSAMKKYKYNIWLQIIGLLSKSNFLPDGTLVLKLQILFKATPHII